MNKPDKIDELANDLDDLKTTAAELEHDPPANVESVTITALQEALATASDVADDLVEQKD